MCSFSEILVVENPLETRFKTSSSFGVNMAFAFPCEDGMETASGVNADVSNYNTDVTTAGIRTKEGYYPPKTGV